MKRTTEKSRRGGSRINGGLWYYYKHQRAPLVLDINGFIHAFRGKDEDARAEIDTYMDYCAKAVANKGGHIPAQTATTLA